MVLIAQSFSKMPSAEHTNVLVMGSATSTLSSRKHRWHQWRRTKHRSSTSFLLQLLKAGGAESNLFWALVCPSRDNCRGTQHRNSRRNSKQHVRTQPVCHELRRHRPYSRSYQDLLSYLSQPQRRRQDLSSSVLLLMGRLQLSLSVCAMQSPSIKSQFRW